MEKLLSGDFPFYRFRNLSAYPELMHFVSSGVKNIGFSDRENPEIIQHNRRSLAEAAGFEVERLITARQVHSATVRIVTAEEAGRGALDRESRIPATDALVTNQPGICLMVLSADCVPVLLSDFETTFPDRGANSRHYPLGIASEIFLHHPHGFHDYISRSTSPSGMWGEK